MSGPGATSGQRAAQADTPQEVLALLRGVSSQRELATRLKGWNRAATDPAMPRFDLHEAIGQGAQGTVWGVTDRDCLRQVAIKTMHERDRLPEDVSRFIHEAQITAQLEHPGVVPVHDLQVLPDGTVFYVMKRIEGRTLAELLPDPEAEPGEGLDRQRAELLGVVLKVLDTLAFAHARGVIHRDLKPRNIMVGQYGEVLVLDWGLAKVLDRPDDTPRHGPAVFSLRSLGEDGGSANATGRGCAVGTPAYMSPEQAEGRPADPRSDVYGMGVILYHVLAGISPYETGVGARGVLEQVAAGVWTPLDERPLGSRLPRRLVAIVHKAMALRPGDRYDNAAALAHDLRSFLAGEAVAAYRESPLDRAVRLVVRHQRVVVTGLAVATLAGLGWAGLEARQAWSHQRLVAEARAAAAAAELTQDWDGARRAYERLLDLVPGDREPPRNLARIKEALAHRAEEDLLRRKRAEAEDLQRKARLSARLGTDEDLAQAKEGYLMALGLVPTDQALAEEYGQVAARLAAREQEREHARLEADRAQRAEALRRKAALAEATGDLQSAIGHLEGALTLAPRAEDTRALTELVQRRDAQERARSESARRAEADLLLSGIAPLLAAVRGRDAREILERARGIDPAHPDLRELEVRIQAAEQAEHEAAARTALGEAERHLAVAHTARAQADEADLTRRRLADALAEAPGDEARRSLQQAETVLDAARVQRASSLASALAALHQARTQAPWYAPVNHALADFFVQRLQEAEAEGLADEAAAAEAQARTYDDGRHAALLAGQSVLRVPANAPTLTLTRIERNELRILAPTGTPITISPGGSATLIAGRWLAEAGNVRLALRLRRGEERALTLAAGTPPPGTAIIPSPEGAPVVALGLTEVTCAEYLVFLNDATVRQEIDAARAAGRLIRVPRAAYTSTEPLWRTRGSVLRTGGGFIVETADGRAIDPQSPVTGISAEDAAAYAAWKARRDGRRWRLPTLNEWRQAVGGGDGRPYPWGEAADLGLCASAPACVNLPKEALPPVGSHPLDRSVQGLFDLAGSVSEFVNGGADAVITTAGIRLVPLMGGSRFEQRPERFAALHRRDMDPRDVHAGAGFRLAVDL